MNSSLEERALAGEISQKNLDVYNAVVKAQADRDKRIAQLEIEKKKAEQELTQSQADAKLKQIAGYVATGVYVIACIVLLVMMFFQPLPAGGTLVFFSWGFFYLLKHFFPEHKIKGLKKGKSAKKEKHQER